MAMEVLVVLPGLIEQLFSICKPSCKHLVYLFNVLPVLFNVLPSKSLHSWRMETSLYKLYKTQWILRKLSFKTVNSSFEIYKSSE